MYLHVCFCGWSWRDNDPAAVCPVCPQARDSGIGAAVEAWVSSWFPEPIHGPGPGSEYGKVSQWFPACAWAWGCCLPPTTYL